jgi:hypothetical protein
MGGKGKMVVISRFHSLYELGKELRTEPREVRSHSSEYSSVKNYERSNKWKVEKFISDSNLTQISAFTSPPPHGGSEPAPYGHNKNGSKSKMGVKSR